MVPTPKWGNPAVTSYKLVSEHKLVQQEGFFVIKVTFLFPTPATGNTECQDCCNGHSLEPVAMRTQVVGLVATHALLLSVSTLLARIILNTGATSSILLKHSCNHSRKCLVPMNSVTSSVTFKRTAQLQQQACSKEQHNKQCIVRRNNATTSVSFE